jgi:formylglycine-generating enzyme
MLWSGAAEVRLEMTHAGRILLSLTGSLACAAAVVAAACGDFSSSPPAAPADGSAQDDAGGAPDGGAHDAANVPDANGLVGTVPIEGLFAIDATEVTNAEYQKFLTSTAALDAGASDPNCAWKRSHAPLVGCSRNTAADAPVSCVDWCDAQAYCAWAGKRLCGGMSGSTISPTDSPDPGLSRWTRACAGGVGKAYSYGDTLEPGRCNERSADAGAPRPVGSFARCEGTPSGLFDMLGNVAEWEDACDLAGPSPDNRCSARGGSYDTLAVDVRCAFVQLRTRSTAEPGIGFRCCSP